MSYDSTVSILKHTLMKSGVKVKGNTRTKKSKSQNHAFRKRFETVLTNSDIHSKYVEYMAGHFEKLTDRNYFKPSDEDVWNEFKKAIPNLTISDEHRKNDEISKLQNSVTDTESLESELDTVKKSCLGSERKIRRENEEMELKEKIKKMWEKSGLSKPPPLLKK